MPDAVPADAVARLPKARMIDPRGHRFGAGISASVLLAAYLLNAPALVAVALLSIGSSAAFGLGWSVYGAAWRLIARVLSLPPAAAEHEYPPRFAQTLGSTVLIASLVAFVAGAGTAGWILVAAVAGLQALLAVTGYCLGCRLYFLRWWVPDLLTRIWTRGRPRSATSFAAESIRYR